MAVFTNDPFTDANGTALTSHLDSNGLGWGTIGAGTAPEIQGNQCLLVTNTGNVAAYHMGVPATPDYDVQCEVHRVGTPTGSNPAFGPTARSETAADTYYHPRFAHSTGAWEFYKRVAGTFTLLGSFTGDTIADGTFRTVKGEHRGTEHRVYVDGVQRIPASGTISDSAITAAGKAGQRLFRTGTVTNGYRLDNFTATDAATGQTIAVAQATETNLAQAVAKAKTSSTAQTVEADTAQAVARAKAKAISQPAETDTAQPVGKTKTIAVTQVVETSTAQPLADRIAVNQTTETDSAQPLGKSKTITVGQAAETDLAQPVTRPGATIVAVAQTVETDLAQAVGKAKIGAAGQVSSTSTAQPISVRKTRSVNQAVETDTPATVTVLKVKTIGQTAETDTPQGVLVLKALTVGRAVEQTQALAVGRLKRMLLSQAIEANVASAVLPSSPRAGATAMKTTERAVLVLNVDATTRQRLQPGDSAPSTMTVEVI